MNTFLTVIGWIALITGIALVSFSAYVAYKKNQENLEKYRRKGIEEEYKPVRPFRWPWAVLASGLVLIILAGSFKIVPTGYTGVKTTFGLIDQESCRSGFNPLIPFVQKISLVNNKQQDLKFDERVWSETSEQTVVYMERITVTYQIAPESSAWIYSNVDNWIEKLIDQDIVSSSLKSVARKLTAANVTDRGIIEPLALEALQNAVDAKYGPERVFIKNLVINNMDFEDSYNDAIASKSAALQEQQEQAIRNQTAIEKATADAEAARIAAQGEADAEKIRAQGKADANKTLSDSITDSTQRQDIIENWNGQMPQYIGANDLVSILFGIFDNMSGTNTSSRSDIVGPMPENR